MANTYPPEILSNQAQKEVTANENFVSLFPASIFANDPLTTALLTFGYYGGEIIVDGVLTLIADGTVLLTDASTNYVEVTRAGVVSANTTGFTAGRRPLYTVVCAGGIITSQVDVRVLAWQFDGYLSKSVAGSSNVTLTAEESRNKIFKFTGAITANIDVILPAIAGGWQFVNATTGAFTLTVKISGGTGIVLATGMTQSMYSDGTDMLAAAAAI